MEKLIKTIFPPKCICCGRYGRSLCSVCLKKCKQIDIGRCIVCQEPSVDGATHFACSHTNTPTGLFSSFEYEGNVRECVRRSKYNSMEFDSLKDLTDEALRYAWKAGVFYQNLIATSVPLSIRRTKTRGFNQVDIIARKVADFYKLEFTNHLLRRGKETTALAELGRAERLKEMEEAFVSNPRIVSGKKILLIDDVCTTGATLLSCSKTLMQAGALEVWCFTIAAVL